MAKGEPRLHFLTGTFVFMSEYGNQTCNLSVVLGQTGTEAVLRGIETELCPVESWVVNTVLIYRSRCCGAVD